jgi:nucleoside-diphosphate-sugar epimerase
MSLHEIPVFLSGIGLQLTRTAGPPLFVADSLRPRCDPVRAVDLKTPNLWFQKFPQADNRSLDLREKDHCYRALETADHVYNLAADMGGMGVIERECVERSTFHVQRFFPQ